MSVRSDVAVCRHCGLVALLAQMARIEEGEHLYACRGCGVDGRRSAR